MARKRRVLIGAGPSPVEGTARVAWFEDECDKFVRRVRAVASYYVTRPDPDAVRPDAKVIIGRIRFMLRQVRTTPALAPQFWNALMAGYAFSEIRRRYHFGDTLKSAKLQRSGSRRGGRSSAKARQATAKHRHAPNLRCWP